MSSESVTDGPGKRRRGFWIFLRDVLVIIVIAALVSFLVKTFIVRSFYIPSASMERTLMVDDRILVDELTPRWTGYQRGDVVVFEDPGGWLPPAVQKPAGPPLLEGIDKLLTVIGLSTSAPIDELSYLDLPEGDTQASNDPFDVTVPEGALWLLGDNRDRSQDARAHQDLPSGGFVPLENVVGKAFLITWPLGRISAVDGHHDIFNGIPDAQ